MKEKNKMIIAATLTIAMVGVLQMANYRNTRSNNEQLEVIRTDNKNNLMYEMPNGMFSSTDIWNDILNNDQLIDVIEQSLDSQDEDLDEIETIFTWSNYQVERYWDENWSDAPQYTCFIYTLWLDNGQKNIPLYYYNTQQQLLAKEFSSQQEFNQCMEENNQNWQNKATNINVNPYNDTKTEVLEQTKQAIYNYLVMNSNNNNIVNTISSGLGLIPNLAQQFLAGFTGLFWNSTNSTLSGFAIFSLTFLGIAISFAIIKLVLNVLRNNTGA